MEVTGKSSKKSVQHIVHTAAQLKGRRIRMARALTEVSRHELCEKIDISASTIDTWESGRVELTEKSAIRICDALRQVGINCSSIWLLSGEGAPPRIMGELERSMIFFPETSAIQEADILATVENKKIPSFLKEEIRKELSFFMELHKEALFYIVDKDLLNYTYREGDCVAGIKESIEKLVGKVVIAELQSGSNILCKLVGYSDGKSEACIIGESSNISVDIVSASEILWYRVNKSPS